MTARHGAGPLPLRIEDITVEFLTAALSRSFPDIRIDRFEIANVRHGFTTVIRIHIDVDAASRAAGCPPTIMLKGGFETFTREKAGGYSITPFAMEVGSYRELKPAVGLNMPICYFAEFDPEREQMIILMEDLLARGVTFGHGLKPYTREQVTRRLTSLAAFHARTWASPDLADGGRWSIFPRNGVAMFRDYMRHAGYDQPQVWRRYVDMPRGAACAVEFHDLEWMLLALDYMSGQAEELPNCVVHGDTHLGNLYEEADGTPGFFDSLPRREPAMVEVAYHITNALDSADRRRWDRELVAHYRDELLRNGVEAPSLDELMRQFAVFLPYGYVTFMINEASYQTESFNTAHTARYNVAMLDHDTKALIEAAARKRH
jgi:hypothetical protein